MATTRYRLTLRGQFPRVIAQHVTFRKKNLGTAIVHAMAIFTARNMGADPYRQYSAWSLVIIDDRGRAIGEPVAEHTNA